MCLDRKKKTSENYKLLTSMNKNTNYNKYINVYIGMLYYLIT